MCLYSDFQSLCIFGADSNVLTLVSYICRHAMRWQLSMRSRVKQLSRPLRSVTMSETRVPDNDMVKRESLTGSQILGLWLYNCRKDLFA